MVILRLRGEQQLRRKDFMANDLDVRVTSKDNN